MNIVTIKNMVRVGFFAVVLIGLHLNVLGYTKPTLTTLALYDTEHNTAKKAIDTLNTLVFDVIFTESPSATVKVEKAALKYNKDFAYSLTLDDGLQTHHTNAYPVLHGGTNAYGGVENGCFYTDGCGSDIAFKAGMAINAKSNGYPLQDVTPDGYHMSWSNIIDLFNEGWDVFNHSYTHAAYDNVAYEDEVKLNTEKIKEKIGFEPTHFVVPSGDREYYNHVFNNEMIAMYDQKWDLVGNGGLQIDNVVLDKLMMYRQYITSSVSYDNINSVATKSVGGKHYWYNDFTHVINNESDPQGGLNIDTLRDYMQHIQNNYGKGSADNVWMAPLQEVYEYIAIRQKVTVACKKLTDNSIQVSVNLANMPSKVRHKALTLKINADVDISSISLISGIDSYSVNKIGDAKIININWSGEVSDTTDETAINDKSILRSKLLLFPNPTENTFNYTLSDNNEVKSLQILSLDGKIIYSTGYSNQQNKIDVSRLLQGVYVVRVVSQNNNIYIQKLIKK